MGLKMKGLCRLKNMTMFAFYNPVLLGSINTSMLISGPLVF
jgi:hypothetical protein